ncbi:unnamed protein product [Lactuca virosa]|uniref:Uncharacterized protein n=1 Tax=Lactuca virosa TaxID=75947 RepID=A0AAU9MGJ0_9ASTR|nr:unnamed protein product [Lactuca virosa]
MNQNSRFCPGIFKKTELDRPPLIQAENLEYHYKAHIRRASERRKKRYRKVSSASSPLSSVELNHGCW